MKLSKEYKLGLFVVIIALATYFVISFLRGKDILDREMDLVANFEQVDNLIATNPVYINGFKAGNVSTIKYDPETKLFKVTCSVLKQFSIPVDSKMVICSMDIMGGKGVRIEMGTAEEFAENGAVLVPGIEADMLTSLGEQITPLLGKATDTLDSLRVAISSVNNLLNESAVAEIHNSIGHLNNTLANLESVAAEVRSRKGEIGDAIDNLSSLTESLKNLEAKAEGTLESADGAIAKISEADIVGLVQEYKELAEKISSEEGTVGKLVNDESAYKNFDQLLTDIDELVNKIKENPRKNIKLSVF